MTSKAIVFDLLQPKKYTIRIIIDENKNNKWDTGNFLLKQQPPDKHRTNYQLIMLI